jgi:Tol biopolymer transport system component
MELVQRFGKAKVESKKAKVKRQKQKLLLFTFYFCLFTFTAEVKKAMRLFVIFLLLGAVSANVWAQETGSRTPQIFAPGVVSTPDNELNAAIAPDGKSLYFTKNAVRKGVIVFSRWRGGKWSTPEVAAFSGLYSDFDPYFSADGSRLFFISNRPLQGAAPKADYDIWFVEKSGTGWSAPKNLGAPVNTEADEFFPALASDGTLYFSAVRAGGKGRFDLYRARPAGVGYGPPENLGELNSPVSEVDCYVAPDQSYLIFASYGRAEGFGDGDLYVSFNQNGIWTKAVNLGRDINSTARDYAPIGSPDGKYLFFTSERGFQDRIPAKPLSFAELGKLSSGLENGTGNIYRVEIKTLKLAELKPKN